MIRIGLGITVMMYALLIFIATNLTFTYILMFSIGMFSCFRLNLGFIYGQEIVVGKHANVIGSINNVIDGCTMIIASLYFKYISKNWFFLHFFFFLISLFGFIISMFLPESPKYLIAKGKYNKARESLNTIASVNRRKALDETDHFIEEYN